MMGSRLHRIGQGMAGVGVGGANANHQEPMEIMGITIDSQSFDQSIIDQSMTSSRYMGKRRHRKQKEDLDGSRLFREHGDDDFNDQSMISQSGNNSPQKQHSTAK